MLVGRRDEESRDDYVEYFLPDRTTTEKRQRIREGSSEVSEEDEFTYFKLREYNYTVNRSGGENNYFFVFRKGEGAYYNELRNKIRLAKRLKVNVDLLLLLLLLEI